MNIGKAMIGAGLGAVVGLPLGFALAILAQFTLVPTRLWNENWPLPVMTVLFAGPFVVLGIWHATRPNRWTAKALRGAGGFALGFLLGVVVALILAVAAAAVFSISQREGAYAMGVVFVIAPLGGLIGGVIGAIWRLRGPATKPTDGL
ncbi:MAG: hypothetical protein Q7J57_12465 [Gemmobacter sp.]|nr:hypothetical protein [Gemmobacter sp.]